MDQLIVKEVVGEVFVRLPNGEVKLVSVGDSVVQGARIMTQAQSSVTLSGTHSDFEIPANQHVSLGADTLAEFGLSLDEHQVAQQSVAEALNGLDAQPTSPSATNEDPSISSFLDALQGDGDILDALEATAAGAGGGAAGGGGTSFVQLTRISETLSGQQLTLNDDFSAQNQGAITVENTGDGVLPEGEAASGESGVITVTPIGLTNNPDIQVSGTSTNMAGQTATVTLISANGVSVEQTVVIDEGGQWQVVFSDEVADGAFEVIVTATDPQGNTVVGTTSGELDTTAPVIVIATPIDEDDPTPAISGSSDLDAGAAVNVLITDAAGATQTLVATVGEDGTWQVQVTQPLVQGEFSVVASSTDEAGNIGQAQAQGSFNGDTDLESLTIDIAAIGTTNDSTPSLAGSTDAPDGSVITITVVDALGNEQSITTTAVAGQWQIDVAQPLAEGEFSVTASVAAGGLEASDLESGLLDSQAPSIVIDSLATISDNTPIISGSSDEIGATVNILVTDAAGVAQSLTAVVQADGSWQVEVPQALAEGEFEVQANVTDLAGNSASDTEQGNIDTTAPSLDIEPLISTGDSTPLISGSSDEIGATVNILVTDAAGVAQSLTAVVQADGSWQVEVPQALAEGEFEVQASVTDAAGNNASDTEQGVIDVSAPEITIDSPAITNDTTPDITGTSSEIGATVIVVITGAEGNRQTLEATVQQDGSWQVQTQQPLGEGIYQVQASVVDASGNSASDTAQGEVDTTAPSLTLNPLGVTNDPTPVISGTSDEIGATIAVEVVDANGTTQSFTAEVQSDGSWQVEVPAELAEGGYQVEASVSDEAGNNTSATASGTIDTNAPDLSIDPLSPTNDVTPTISGSSSAIGAAVNLTLTDANGQIQTVTAVVAADGSWQVEVPQALAEGVFTVSASVTDAQGNEAQANTQGQIDVTAPTLSIDPLGAQSDTTPIISGVSSQVGASVVIEVTDSDGTTQTLTAVVQSDGRWQIEASQPLAEGDYTVLASVTDEAGNNTQASAQGSIDASAPDLTIDNPGIGNDTTPIITGSSSEVGATVAITVVDASGNTQTVQATVQGDGTWSASLAAPLAEGQYTITAEVSDNAGNQANDQVQGEVDITAPPVTISPVGSVNDETPVISGSAEGNEGDVVSITVVDASGDSQSFTALLAGDGSWTAEVPTALAEGDFDITASITDAAGNEGTDNESGTVDTAGPGITIDPVGVISDATPVISGISAGAAPGAVVSIVVVDALSNVQNLSATVGADGTWSANVGAALAEGEFTITASVDDGAGNTSTDSETGVIDTLAPSVEIDPLELTNDNTPLISGGSSEANSQLTLIFTDSQGNSQSVITTTDANGNWQVSAPSALADGTYTVAATIVDDAGNTGTDSQSAVIDTIGPELTIVPSFLLGNLVSLSGTSDLPAGSEVTITEHLVGGGIGATYTAITDADGNWTLVNLTVPLLTLAYVTASASDAAGNSTTISTLDFDNEPPVLSIDTLGLTNDSTPVISGTTDVADGTVVEVIVTDALGDQQTLQASTSNGNWSVAVPTALAEGGFTVEAAVRDDVGNLTEVSATGEVDTTAPSLSVNVPANGNDNTPLISGTSDEIGATVSVTVTDGNGDSQNISTVVAADGTWAVTPSALSDGTFSVSATIMDDAGNTTTVSNTGSIDTQGVSVTLDPLGLGNDATPLLSGTSSEIGREVSIIVLDNNGDTYTLSTTVDGSGNWSVPAPSLAEGDYTVTVSVSDAAGNSSSASDTGTIDTIAPTVSIDPSSVALTNDNTPQVSGSSNEANAQVSVQFVDDAGTIHTVTTNTDNNGDWSISASAVLVDGQYTVTARVTDQAGNTGSAVDSGIIDTTPISFEVTDFDPGILGLVLPSAEGTAPAGTEIYIIGSSLLGVGLAGIDLDVLSTYPSTTTDGDGNWQYTLSLLDVDLLSGEDYYFVTIDDAGNYLVKDTDNQEVDRGSIYDNAAADETLEASVASEDDLAFESGEQSHYASVETLDYEAVSLSLNGEQFTEFNQVKEITVNAEQTISESGLLGAESILDNPDEAEEVLAQFDDLASEQTITSEEHGFEGASHYATVGDDEVIKAMLDSSGKGEL
ncbi:retention module-containing protein [Pseudoalteromonas ruthenica]|uniref:retention module-containing protein n=5 Tax=Pseudoalteromonas ruthenica TaxID=151081 RepID=UPI0006984E70|nr:retention module-containing protein [Pseudoalteromonas ruthenica]TMO86781.1 Ig-like domain repeat protein [Pseudoalteromonas ruthenica]TMO93400.1 Ig-like domain repeat protein [Pseudoalteromonas ruthenica]TMP23247.1 Ig-like domain repeat protein [Pseudoalteromonas ruthenica]